MERKWGFKSSFKHLRNVCFISYHFSNDLKAGATKVPLGALTKMNWRLLALLGEADSILKCYGFLSSGAPLHMPAVFHFPDILLPRSTLVRVHRFVLTVWRRGRAAFGDANRITTSPHLTHLSSVLQTRRNYTASSDASNPVPRRIAFQA